MHWVERGKPEQNVLTLFIPTPIHDFDDENIRRPT